MRFPHMLKTPELGAAAQGRHKNCEEGVHNPTGLSSALQEYLQLFQQTLDELGTKVGQGNTTQIQAL